MMTDAWYQNYVASDRAYAPLADPPEQMSFEHLETWTIYYFTIAEIKINFHTGREFKKWEKNIVGEIVAVDALEALREAYDRYGRYEEIGYRLRAEMKRDDTTEADWATKKFCDERKRQRYVE